MSKEENTDEVYADPPQHVEDVDDITPEPVPESADLGALVDGDRGSRLRVKVQPHGHLLADLQEIADRIDAYDDDADVPAALVDDWVDVKARFDAADTYVVTGRNSDWLRHLATSLKERGLCGDLTIRQGMLVPLPGERDGTAEGGGEYAVTARAVLNAQLAAQMVRVGPLGQEVAVEPQDLADLYARAEPEADKLFRAVVSANTQPVKMLMPDFSARVSRLSRRGSA